MHIENYIEAKYRELSEKNLLNNEFSELYNKIKGERLQEVFSSIHYNYVSLFRKMNERLPTEESEAYFWAEPSRALIANIEMTMGLHENLKESEYAFEIDSYYLEIITNCRDFLRESNGSFLPIHMKEVVLYYTIPIFINKSSINVKNPHANTFALPLNLIGSGSYAHVYKYKDTYYDKYFALKRANKNLSNKEIERFKREFTEMKALSSPYILEVYFYNKSSNEYTMEYADYTLYAYISANNSTLSTEKRMSIARQILRAFNYIHQKKRLHRDISPKNILLKEYDEIIVVKVSDFGLVKTPDSILTAEHTDFKGYFNDPALITEGFENYGILHETFALTRLIYFTLTGKTNTDKISDKKLQNFVNKGLCSDKSKRFQSVTEMIEGLPILQK